MSGPGPIYRSLDATVVSTARVGTCFVRVTLRTDDRPLGLAGADQRVNLVLPAPDGTARVADGESVYEAWRAMPERSRPLLRTYTVRRARPGTGEVDLDVVLHGDDAHAGPASSWAAAAAAGDRAQLVGPDRDGRGRGWGAEWDPPAGARRLVLAGDETALPAIAAVLEQADEQGPPLLALVEVPRGGDRLELVRPARAQVWWGVRGARPLGEALGSLVRAALPPAGGSAADDAPTTAPAPGDEAGPLWDVAEPRTDASTYVWLAGEAGALRPIRRHLRDGLGLPRSSTSVMGYWRQGAAGG